MGVNDRTSSGQEEQADSDLKVTDRRLFTSDGQPRQEMSETEVEEPEQETPPARPEEAPAAAPEADTARAEFEHRPVDEPKGVDFTMLINALAQQALIFLGEIAYPGAEKPAVDLEQARFQIDLLDMLRVKTRGNLTPEEEGLLDQMLYQLRMLFVNRSSKPE